MSALRQAPRIIRFRPEIAGLTLVLAGLGGSASLAAPTSQDFIYQSVGLRIYRATSRQGTPVVVLTNLDEDGNVLPGHEGAGEEAARSPRLPNAEDAGVAPAPPPPQPACAEERPGLPGASVLIHQGGDAAPVDGRDVEVQPDGAGGTTVVININLPAAPAGGTTIVPGQAYPFVPYGGLVGPFHYPDHLYFLGYGPGNDTPVFFGGLGLSSTDRYARASGRPRGAGAGHPGGARSSSP
jgi:hypothetical protein